MNQVADMEKGAIFAEEALVVDVQVFLHNLMEDKDVSRADLARKMGVSRARVSQMLSDDCPNLTMRLFARAAYALGENVEFDCQHFQAKRDAKERNEAISAPNVVWLQEAKWTDDLEIACDEGDQRIQSFVTLSSERLAA